MKALITISSDEKGAANVLVRRVADDETTHEQTLQPGEELAVSFSDEPVYVLIGSAEEDPQPAENLDGGTTS